MTKRQDEEMNDVLPKKRPRFRVLADYDDGDVEGSSQNADEKVVTVLKQQKGKRPSITINRTELNMNDITRICHSFVVNNDVKRPGWLKLNNFKQPGQLVFARINCTLEQLQDEGKQLKFSDKFFDRKWTAVNTEVSNSTVYWDQLLRVKTAKREQLKALFEKEKDPLKELHSDEVLKLALLTTTEEMANLDYPLQGFEEDDIIGVPAVVPTKEKYTRVKKDSPIYTLDCEMCVTELNRSELTRVTLIDENGTCLIDSFVKPFNNIIDYVTCFSGVTEESLKNVSVRLVHVQEAFRRILPPDAILCAHSIENDLKALRMSHPYCIDVGFAYNMVNKKVRTSLRGLMYYYFNERIQSSGMGHCSYEDAWAALRLLKLKLENGISFGSISLGFNYVEWAKKQNFIDCAQLFSISTAKDFAKDPYQAVTLPDPRKIGQCISCKTPLMSQCQITNCLCIERSTKHCCLCIGQNIQHAQLEEKDLFNFGSALSVLSEVSFTPSMKEILKKYKKRRVMIARYLENDEDAAEMTSKSLHVYNMSNWKSLPEIEEEVFDDKIMSHDLCLLEYNAENLTISEIDDYIKALHNRVSNNGVLGILFCTPTKSILCLNVKTL